MIMKDSKLRVVEDQSGDLFIEWDDDHPFASIFDNWTEEEWMEAIRLGQERAATIEDGK
jgi:hypothetical protein